MTKRLVIAAALLLAACGTSPNTGAPLVSKGPLSAVPFPPVEATRLSPQLIAQAPPARPDAIAQVATKVGAPAAPWFDRQLDLVGGWKIGGDRVVGVAETGAMRSAVQSWLAQCGDDGACLERRQFNMLRTLTKGIDGAGWGGRYAGPHWTLYVLPAQFVDEVDAVFVLDRGGRACSIALTGLLIDTGERWPLPDPRDGNVRGRDRLVLTDPAAPSTLIRFTRVGSKVWVHRTGPTPTLDSQCRAGAIYGEYRSQEPTAVKVSYLGAPGLEPIAPHIMVPGP